MNTIKVDSRTVIEVQSVPSMLIAINEQTAKDLLTSSMTKQYYLVSKYESTAIKIEYMTGDRRYIKVCGECIEPTLYPSESFEWVIK